MRPIHVYCNWSAYDELSDPAAPIELTEELALCQLEHLVRLRRQGVRLDYYLMDCFWYGPDSGYRSFRRPHFPDDGERWLGRCAEAGVLPGLWIGLNSLATSRVSHPDWGPSLTADGNASLSAGPFLDHLMATLTGWYARGVRLFKFDFANLGAGTPRQFVEMLPSELRAANVAALRGALSAFRQRHADCLLLCYNGLEEVNQQSGTATAPRRSLDPRWMECFDSVYTGDPRPADVPAADFWHAIEVYSDHQVRAYHAQGWPLARLDNAGFMIGTTPTCYGRGRARWKSMLLLSLARGGRITTYYGNLDLIDDAEARWWARAQELCAATGDTRPIGDLPGSGGAYGWATRAGHDGLWTLVNPAQRRATLRVTGAAGADVIFTDGDAVIPAGSDGNDLEITLSPEGLAVLGRGAQAINLGREEAPPRPQDLVELTVERLPADAVDPLAVDNRASWRLPVPAIGRIRLVIEIRRGSKPLRTCPLWAGKPLVAHDRWLPIQVTQADGQRLPVERPDAKAIWAGLSWAVGRFTCASTEPILITAMTYEPQAVTLSLRAYHEVGAHDADRQPSLPVTL